MLYTHQDYVDRLRQDVADDFANLPAEVVHDIIELASFEKEKVVKDLKKLALIEGSWAKFGNKFAMAACLRKTTVDSRTDLNELKAKASQLCGHIHLFCAPNQFYESLELMGTRFSSIKWFVFKNPSDFASLQMTRFLKRQLKSKHLRSLIIHAEVQTDLSKLFVDFVKRPHFEELYVGEIRLPVEVFEEALKSWESQVLQNAPLSNKEVHARISHESAKKLKKHFNVTGDRVFLKHPVHGEAEADLQFYNRCADVRNVEMILGSLAKRSGCVEEGYVSDCVDSDSSSEEDDDDNMDNSYYKSRSRAPQKALKKVDFDFSLICRIKN